MYDILTNYLYADDFNASIIKTAHVVKRVYFLHSTGKSIFESLLTETIWIFLIIGTYVDNNFRPLTKTVYRVWNDMLKLFSQTSPEPKLL